MSGPPMMKSGPPMMKVHVKRDTVEPRDAASAPAPTEKPAEHGSPSKKARKASKGAGESKENKPNFVLLKESSKRIFKIGFY